jgi:peptide chain release factor 3
MDTQLERLRQEVRRRRTFAIISHPDAGKTTLTEKLLLYGGAIHLAGSVKSRKATRHATSDWMELEKQRGISITSSVLQFDYGGRKLNILDTPGHQDFSEDTYRTLLAADSAVMLIDAAKGVEAQTKKLFKVCRARGIPIFTFVNKLDRFGKPPIELMDELESVLGIRSCPVNWPIGMGTDFKGVFDRQRKVLHLFEAVKHGAEEASAISGELDSPAIVEVLGEERIARLRDELELLDVAGDPFDLTRIEKGELTPMFFGSAMNNFGVRPFLEAFLELAPGPLPRESTIGPIDPDRPTFSGFVFKIQANMDPAHRDRIAFLRICSGRFAGGMDARHVRLERSIRLAKPQQFMAQQRTAVDEAFAGDVVGLFDPGQFRIGDTLCEGPPFEFTGFPRFSPELFARVEIKDALKRKQLKKGLEQLTEEGAIQLFKRPGLGDVEPVVGAVGGLQFEVLSYRLENEYGCRVNLARLPFAVARWVEGAGFNRNAFDDGDTSMVVLDRDELPLVLFRNEWALNYAADRAKDVVFRDTPPKGLSSSGA